MNKKQFFKNVWNRSAWIGLVFMGALNCYLLYKHFKHAAPMPETASLLFGDCVIVLFFIVIGMIAEFIDLKKGRGAYGSEETHDEEEDL